ncbi:inorganic phosphate transporter, PiT family [Caldanaerovirga acetigignens]|uniref:Inorganic phosphate transporter, PiT family n=1 Tax=Caldanaerovirga acetigignens TaxID=447595 RepID=A0A1M7IQK0_9FIRM|nr:inorganic phosphate transporter [Caldanaerovirga acetigignens]SHM43092.1 inorganic phosphate transporter, PiT family [Caldanaerovirga acetigignens]
MSVAFSDFLGHVLSNKALMITVLLMMGVIFVNGWTDATNAIATCISTRSISPRAAIVMAAVFNFIGGFVMTIMNPMVAETIYNMVDFGADARNALVALCAALFAIVLWATAAWWFGIPTSESHALIAGVSGAAIALQGGIGGINPAEWIKVIYGLGLSLFLGFFTGWATVKTTEIVLRGFNRRKLYTPLRFAQIISAAGMAFMHGAQDGQKFMGVFMLGIFLAQGQASVTKFVIPLWLIVLCSLVIALGTSLGGMRIIKSIGLDMVKLETYQGFSADLAGVICLFIASVFGLPVSTTHTKTTAIMGVGAAKRISAVNWGIVKEMFLAWVLTFPGCGLISFLMALAFMKVF